MKVCKLMKIDNNHKQGDFVFNQGEPSDKFYIILEVPYSQNLY